MKPAGELAVARHLRLDADLPVLRLAWESGPGTVLLNLVLRGIAALVPLAVLLVVLGAVGAARAQGARVVAASWALVPLVLLTLGDLVRPLFWPRYLLTGLIGVGVLAATGAWALPRLARVPAARGRTRSSGL